MADEPETAGEDSPAESVFERLDALFAPWNRTDAPGMAIGIAKHGDTLYRRGFGMASLETGVANTPRTRMRIGSTSKHITCMLALLLAEDGALDLDAPIRRYVSELAGPAGDPTLRQLMQHRGGLRCHLDLGFITHGMAMTSPGAALAVQLRQSGRNFAPGEAMIYSNGGYHLLSIAIERVGGAPFEEQLRQRLFAPLGMADTESAPSDYAIIPGIATQHIPRSGGGWQRGLFPSEEVRGEGGIVATVDDMLRWMAHLRTRDRFGSPASWQALTAAPIEPDRSTGVYALGLVLGHYRGLKTLSHSGGVIGGTCQMLTLPADGLDIILLANGAPGADAVRLAEQVVDIVLANNVSDGPPTIPTRDHQALLGDWWSSETGMIYSLVDRNGRLTLQIGSPHDVPLEPMTDGRLVARTTSMSRIVLDLDAASPDEISIAFGGKVSRYRRISSEDADALAFAGAAVGRYYSADADASAVIAREGDRLVIRMFDSFGHVEANLVAVGESVASTTPMSLTEPSWWSLSFVQQGGAMTGFRLNTMRTRDLRFQRVEEE